MTQATQRLNPRHLIEILERNLGRPPTQDEIKGFLDTNLLRETTSTPANSIGPAEAEQAEDKTGLAGLVQDAAGLFKRDDGLGFRLLQTLGNVGGGIATGKAIKKADEQTAQSQAHANLINALARRPVARATMAQPRLGLLGQLSQGVSDVGQMGLDVQKLKRTTAQQDIENTLNQQLADARTTSALAEQARADAALTSALGSDIPETTTLSNEKAQQLASTITRLRQQHPGLTIDQLIPLAGANFQKAWALLGPDSKVLVESYVTDTPTPPATDLNAFELDPLMRHLEQYRKGNPTATLEEALKQTGNQQAWDGLTATSKMTVRNAFEVGLKPDTISEGDSYLYQSLGFRNPEAAAATLIPQHITDPVQRREVEGYIRHGQDRKARLHKAAERGTGLSVGGAADLTDAEVFEAQVAQMVDLFLNSDFRNRGGILDRFLQLIGVTGLPEIPDEAGQPIRLELEDRLFQELYPKEGLFRARLSAFSVLYASMINNGRPSDEDRKAAAIALPIIGESEEVQIGKMKLLTEISLIRTLLVRKNNGLRLQGFVNFSPAQNLTDAQALGFIPTLQRDSLLGQVAQSLGQETADELKAILLNNDRQFAEEGTKEGLDASGVKVPSQTNADSTATRPQSQVQGNQGEGGLLNTLSNAIFYASPDTGSTNRNMDERDMVPSGLTTTPQVQVRPGGLPTSGLQLSDVERARKDGAEAPDEEIQYLVPAYIFQMGEPAISQYKEHLKRAQQEIRAARANS